MSEERAEYKIDKYHDEKPLSTDSLKQEQKYIIYKFTDNFKVVDSVEIGIITDIQDPDGMNRIKVNLPTYGSDCYWARVTKQVFCTDIDSVSLFKVGVEVLVTFINGNIRQPVIIGSF